MVKLVLDPPGQPCSNTGSGGHQLLAPADDSQLQSVLQAVLAQPAALNYTRAIRAATDYVLDGANTGRFDVLGSDVHPGERAAIGAKLEYEVLSAFGWKKRKPLDTVVGGVPVDLKATVGKNWTIPDEAHCQLCLCTQIDFKAHRHRTWLVRAHSSWLHRGKGNKDHKRGLAAHALEHWSEPLYDWEPLPRNPLLALSESQKSVVFADKVGQAKRLLALFGYLPDTVLERSVIETVCARRDDPLRRVRQLKELAAAEGLTVLCGTWTSHRAAALEAGFSLSKGDWIALSARRPGPS